jgi:hypothetical protein
MNEGRMVERWIMCVCDAYLSQPLLFFCVVPLLNPFLFFFFSSSFVFLYVSFLFYPVVSLSFTSVFFAHLSIELTANLLFL